MSSTTRQSLANASNNWKNTYGPISKNAYNSANVTLGRVKKTYKFTGKQKIKAIPTTLGGGVGSGTLPQAGKRNPVNVMISAKKVYARCEIDRESIKAADGNEGSWVAETKDSVKHAVNSFNRNMSRILFNELDNGQLGTGDGSTTVTGDGSASTPYVVVMSATDWKEANWEEEDGVNCGSETTILVVSEVVPSTRTVKFVGTSATLASAASGTTSTSAKFYMQGSKDNDPQSLLKALLLAEGQTLYGATTKRRYVASLQEDSNNQGIVTDMFTDDVLEIQRKCGEIPHAIVASYTQFKKAAAQLDDKKTVELMARAEELKYKVGFKGIAVTTPFGDVPLFLERFLPEDSIAYLNYDAIEIDHRPDFGWFDDDGTVFMRMADDDAYEARYGGYMEVVVNPAFCGVRSGLAV